MSRSLKIIINPPHITQLRAPSIATWSLFAHLSRRCARCRQRA